VCVGGGGQSMYIAAAIYCLVNLLGHIFHLSIDIELDFSLASEQPAKSIEVVVRHTLA